MLDRREPMLSNDERTDVEASQRFPRASRFREPTEYGEEPSFVFWVAAIALGVLLGGLGVKLITDWYASRQAEAAVRLFVTTVNGVNEQANRQLTASTAVANAQAATVRAHAAAVVEKQRAQEMAVAAERQRIERLRIVAAEQAAAEKGRRDAAWAKFYRPSPDCQVPENRATMQCANEYARAHKEFQRRWAQGVI